LKRLVTAILAASLLLTVFVVAPVAAASYENCQEILGNNIHNGINIRPNGGFANTRGVRSVMYQDSRVHRCINNPATDVNNGASYWVAITPAPGNSNYGDTDAIFQVGVIYCYDSFYPGAICDDGGQNEPQFFWAEGGCNASPIAKEFDGPAPYGAIDFRVEYLGNGQLRASAYWGSGWSESASITTTTNNPETSCWTDEEMEGDIYCERWDSGDGCGDSPPNSVGATLIRYQQAVGGKWWTPGETGAGHGQLTDAQCNEETSEDFCDVVAADQVRLWTVQN
jgi:hypothetical protein